MAPLVEAVAAQYEGRVRLHRLRVDRSPAEARALGVRAVPTLVALHDGREVVRAVGRQSRVRLDRIFQRALLGGRAGPLGPTPLDRLLRTGASVVIAILALSAGSPVLLGAAAAMLFGAFWDVFLTRSGSRK